MAKKKKMVIGETIIAQLKKQINGKDIIFTVFYGNIVRPKINNQSIYLQKETYQEMVELFIASEDGKEYNMPSQKQLESDMKLALKNEPAKQESVAKIATKPETVTESEHVPAPQQVTKSSTPVEQKSDAEKDVESKYNKLVSENEITSSLLKTYQKQNKVLITVCVLLAFVVLFQMLLNIYLYARG